METLSKSLFFWSKIIYALNSRKPKRKIFKHQLDMILRCLAVGRPGENSQSMSKRWSKKAYTCVLEKLKNFFSSIPDKQQAWDDLHRLTNDKDSDVRSRAASALGSAFPQSHFLITNHKMGTDKCRWIIHVHMCLFAV